MLKGEDLDENASHCEMHGHLVGWTTLSEVAGVVLENPLTHLRVILERTMIYAGCNAYAYEAPVWKIGGCEEADILALEPLDSEIAIADCWT